MQRLLVIDSHVTNASPTMGGWLRAAGGILPEFFDEVEVWGFKCGLEAPWLKFHKIKPITTRWAIQSLFYDLAVRKRFRQLPGTYLKETLVQCTGVHLPYADIRYIQFWHTAYAEAADSRPGLIRLPWKDRVLGGKIKKEEAKALQLSQSREWWCVSEGIAAPIRRDGPGGIQIRYLPNSYDSSKFSHEMRQRWQTRMREHYQFNPDEIVLAFSAFGHFERKGLRQAIQTVSLLRAAGHSVKLLVLGGSDTAIHAFKSGLRAADSTCAGVVFAGLVSNIEQHLAAADAFFFPSHFEAFSLAVIEAGALGLRLYLTAHPGHEMILEEHTNGRLLPWDPQGMAAIIEEEIKSGRIRTHHAFMGRSLTTGQFSDRLRTLYAQACLAKWPAEPG